VAAIKRLQDKAPVSAAQQPLPSGHSTPCGCSQSTRHGAFILQEFPTAPSTPEEDKALLFMLQSHRAYLLLHGEGWDALSGPALE